VNAAEYLLGPEALAKHGERVALVCGEEALSYRRLAEDTARAGAAYTELGVRPGEVVLLLMRDTPEFAAAWLGALHAGAVAIAINNKLSEAEYRHILRDSGARLALVEDVFAGARPDLSAELAREHRLVVAGDAIRAGTPSWRALLERARPRDAFAAPPGWPAFYLYSSGTTGPAKGIVHSHEAVLHVGAALRMLGTKPGDKIFTTSRFFFAYGLEHGLLGPLCMGATSIACADWPDADAVLAVVSAHKPRLLFSVPTVYRRLLAEPPQRLAALRTLDYCIAAGERLSPQLVQQWRASTGVELLSLYGMSETFCACLVTPPGSSDGLRTGAPLPGLQWRLLDAGGAPVQPGRPGVLWVRHPAQATQYHNLPERTRDQFKDGWFCTRDLFVQDSGGHFVHQGRSDELVKIAGQWVLPAELEEAAAAAPQVLEAVCVPVPDRDGLERLAVFVIPRGDHEEAVRAAEQACERALPRHKRPKWLRALEQLPRTATGKVQRYKLRELLEQELKSPP
jgi:3-hydroxybenzoate/4-hydroxybenzoate---CoA ligase